MRTRFLYLLLAVVIVFSFVSCQEDVTTSYKTPTIKGTVSLPSGATVEVSDFYIKVVEGDNTVYTGKHGG